MSSREVICAYRPTLIATNAISTIAARTATDSQVTWATLFTMQPPPGPAFVHEVGSRFGGANKPRTANPRNYLPVRAEAAGEGPSGATVEKVPASGTPMLPTGMYTTVWLGEFTIIFWASIASCCT